MKLVLYDIEKIQILHIGANMGYGLSSWRCKCMKCDYTIGYIPVLHPNDKNPPRKICNNVDIEYLYDYEDGKIPIITCSKYRSEIYL